MKGIFFFISFLLYHDWSHIIHAENIYFYKNGDLNVDICGFFGKLFLYATNISTKMGLKAKKKLSELIKKEKFILKRGS